MTVDEYNKRIWNNKNKKIKKQHTLLKEAYEAIVAIRWQFNDEFADKAEQWLEENTNGE